MDGKGEFQYVENPQPLGPKPELPQPDPRLHGTAKTPQAQGDGSSAPPLIERTTTIVGE